MSLSGTNKDKLRTLNRILQRFGQFDLHIQLSTIQMFLLIASKDLEGEPLSTGDLVKSLGLSNAAASRNTYYWSDGTPDGKIKGLEMITIDFDPLDRRRRTLRLTPKGRAFFNQIMELYDGS